MNNIDHESMGYVEDQNNLIAGISIEDLQSYLRQFKTLLIHYYGLNRLKLNDKTQIMILRRQFKRCLSIQAHKSKDTFDAKTLKQHFKTNLTFQTFY